MSAVMFLFGPRTRQLNITGGRAFRLRYNNLEKKGVWGNQKNVELISNPQAETRGKEKKEGQPNGLTNPNDIYKPM